MKLARSIKPSGFTLVELLVVVAIITVLAAMLLPVLEKSLIISRQISCASQMHQLNLGLQLYADTYNNYAFWGTNPEVSQYPGCGFATGYQRGINYWLRLMIYNECDTSKLWYGGAYGGDIKGSIFTDTSPTSIFAGEPYPNKEKFISYVFNGKVMPHPFYMGKLHVNLSTLAASTAFTFACATNYGKNSYGEPVGDCWRGILWDTQFETYINWRAHNEGANGVFLDGHTKWYPRWTNLYTKY